MNTLIDIFRESVAFKIFIGIVTFLFTTATNNEEVNYQTETSTSKHTLIDIALNKKIMEVDNAYYSAYIKTIE
ncbi:MAG: hypothetical protein JXR05_02560 [Flavobacteriaceae bacterium]